MSDNNRSDDTVIFPSPEISDKISVNLSQWTSKDEDITNRKSSVDSSLIDEAIQLLQKQSIFPVVNCEKGQSRKELASEVSELKRKLKFAQDSIDFLEIQKDKALNALEEARAKGSKSIHWSTLLSSLSDHELMNVGMVAQKVSKCWSCKEKDRTRILDPCKHFALCDGCAVVVKKCPDCLAPITATTNGIIKTE